MPSAVAARIDSSPRRSAHAGRSSARSAMAPNAASSSPSRASNARLGSASLAVPRSRPPSRASTAGSRSGAESEIVLPPRPKRTAARNREPVDDVPPVSSPTPPDSPRPKRAAARRRKGNASASPHDSDTSVPVPMGKRTGGLDALGDLDAALPPISRSAPAPASRLRGRAEAADWDMPTGPTQRMEPLTWQQQAAPAAAAPKTSRVHAQADGRPTRTSPRKAAVAAPAPVAPVTILKRGQTEPLMRDEPALTWQQELMRSSKPTPSSGNGPLPAWADASSKPPKPPASAPPASGKRRPHSAAVEPFAMDDVFAPASTSPAPAVDKRARHKSASGVSSLAKAATSNGNGATANGPASFGYAGPRFHDSPSPASLPTPRILTRRAVGTPQ